MQAYVGDIITNARRDTRNADDIPTPTTSVGINTNDFLRYANYAQQRLQGRISKVVPHVFEVSCLLPVIENQAVYTIPDNLYLARVVKVEYARSGEMKDLLPLLPVNPYYTDNSSGYPARYHRQNTAITLEPVPSTTTGMLRITYERALDRLDIRRGVITNSATSSGFLTALSISPTTDDELAFASPLSKYLCLNNADGTVRMYNIPYDSYNSTTGDFALQAFQYALGEYAQLGDYVTIGKYTTTHSKLPEDAERYLTEYITRRIKKRESSSDAAGVDADLNDIEQEIINSYKVADRDVKHIPIADYTLAVTDFSGWDS